MMMVATTGADEKRVLFTINSKEDGRFPNVASAREFNHDLKIVSKNQHESLSIALKLVKFLLFFQTLAFMFGST